MNEEELTVVEKEIEIQDFSTPSNNKYFANLTFKEKAILDIATLIYQDKDLLDRAVAACGGSNSKQTMVGYVSKYFSHLLSKFPSVQEEYLNQVRQKHNKLKKARQKR